MDQIRRLEKNFNFRQHIQKKGSRGDGVGLDARDKHPFGISSIKIEPYSASLRDLESSVKLVDYFKNLPACKQSFSKESKNNFVGIGSYFVNQSQRLSEGGGSSSLTIEPQNPKSISRLLQNSTKMRQSTLRKFKHQILENDKSVIEKESSYDKSQNFA